MSRICFICGKKTVFGSNVSHANNKTKRAWIPNLQSVRISVNGESKKKQKVCTSCISAGKTMLNASV